MTVGLLLVVAGISALVLVLAATVMLGMSDTDAALLARIDAARGQWTARDKGGPGARVHLVHGTQRLLSEIGRMVMQSGVLPGRTRAELLQTLSAAGFRGANALPLFVGCKLAMLFGLPLAALLVVRNSDMQMMTSAVLVLGSGIFGMVAPDMIIQRRRIAQLAKIDRGLSDALDLMVICAQAGLSLEPAMTRVANELRGVHPEMCEEIALTVRELEIMSDSSQALSNLGQRTGLEGLIRLTATLIQTLQYGTPLSESLRTLSNEMRTSALTTFEERAARLPVLLTLPMIMFILPTVFMVVGGPAAIQLSRGMGG